MEFVHANFYGNTIYEWAISIALIVSSFLLGKIALWLFTTQFRKITAKTKTTYDDIVLNMIEKPVVTSIVATGIYLGFLRLHLPPAFDQLILKAYHGVLILMVTWLIARTTRAFITTYIVPLANKTENELDDQLLPILQKGLHSGIWVLGIIVALNNAGFNVGAIIAGMGIGGLALAMAAKDTVSNFFGGVTIFVDKPFKLRDRIKVGGHDGTVVEIGIRTTRLQTLEGRIITIPNTFFTASMVENVSLEPSRKVVTNLGLTYDTKPEELALALKILQQINQENPSTEEKILASFNQFGDFSLNLLFIYYIKAGADIFQTQTDINLAILTQFNQHNLAFAFPTQTLEIVKK